MLHTAYCMQVVVRLPIAACLGTRSGATCWLGVAALTRSLPRRTVIFLG